MEQPDSEGAWEDVVQPEGVWDGVKLTEFVELLEKEEETVLLVLSVPDGVPVKVNKASVDVPVVDILYVTLELGHEVDD